MQDFYDAIAHLAGGQVYALLAPPQAPYPTLVYTPIEQTHIVSLDGPSALRRCRIQVDAYARTLVQCHALQEQVLAALLAALSAVADVRLGLADFDEQARIYRVSVDYSYFR